MGERGQRGKLKVAHLRGARYSPMEPTVVVPHEAVHTPRARQINDGRSPKNATHTIKSRLQTTPKASCCFLGDEISVDAVLGMAMIRYGRSEETRRCRVYYGSTADASRRANTFHIYLRVSRADQIKP